MIFRSAFIFLLALFTLSSCSHKVVRIGYAKQKSDQTECPVTITKKLDIADNAVLLGAVRLKDSGFSAVCSEKDAMEILKAEACAIGANLIVIKNEKRPDFVSTCYRCEASFYKSDNSPPLKPNSSENNVLIPKNPEANRQVVGYILGSALGFVAGYALVYLMLN